MKRIKHLVGAVIIAAMAMIPHGLRAETTEETTTTTTSESSGTVDSLASGALIIQSDTTPTPTSYGYTKTTTYVDQDGNPVSIETVKSGAPVTVFYTKGADGLVASKVVVKKSTSGDPLHPTTTIEEKRTTVTKP